MTVKEYIEYLKTLDPDKGIWVTYDFPYAMFDPKPDTLATERHVKLYGDIGVKLGDYVIEAG
jgi:hypothetical protein